MQSGSVALAGATGAETQPATGSGPAQPARASAALLALCTIARLHQIAADPLVLAHQLGLAASEPLELTDLLRAAQHLGLKAKVSRTTLERLPLTPLPALAVLKPAPGNDGPVEPRVVLLAQCDGQRVLFQEGANTRPTIESTESFAAHWTGQLILITSRASLVGELAKFDFSWFIPSLVKHRKAQCVIVGRDEVSYGQKPRRGGTWREVMLKEVGDRLPMDRVHFVGGLPYGEYLKVLQVSTCHVYLTYPFVLGWSCVEALSAGCTVVGSNTGPVREVIEDGKTGLLTDFFDAPALARRVVDVLQEPGAFAHLGVAARAQVVGRYDLQTICLPRQLALIATVSPHS